MARLVLATCEKQPLVTADDRILADALVRHGVSVEAIPWTQIDPFAVVDAPPILLRSTWDYHRVPTMFRSWLDALAESGRPTWNPPQVARDNIDKIYLKDLEARGVAIPKTRWLDAPHNDAIAEVMREESWTHAVLKPRVAATAYGTFLIDRATDLDADQLAPARASNAMLQELIPEVAATGEMSLVYFEGAFSHAVLKRAKPDEFRVQKDFGGSVAVVEPSAAIRAFADRVIAMTPECLYARVDLVDTARGPLLMELELIEPELYFVIVPEAAAPLAAILAALLLR